MIEKDIPKQHKCDFCEKPFLYYGAYQCSMYCEDHIKDGEAVEDKMFAEMERSWSGEG